ncbi:hypothetical protein OG2516_01134 [Oceanicola granulosus HTCC2516]|uniref:Uncharacterized protein n=1 Tax=Oceanicola granulosus (strain ATCC BAA-861 / DSM 15982 / KCTC 12143 / HTCC2516) TaxID=314256 RepID=Q2CJ13_OCEGH|nr:hypothetical protein [Oceanicola granulosus]EAR52787.1 hypothetical protein OG2516_01134 [Oceanicola granulosus HTCC2516]
MRAILIIVVVAILGYFGYQYLANEGTLEDEAAVVEDAEIVEEEAVTEEVAETDAVDDTEITEAEAEELTDADPEFGEEAGIEEEPVEQAADESVSDAGLDQGEDESDVLNAMEDAPGAPVTLEQGADATIASDLPEAEQEIVSLEGAAEEAVEESDETAAVATDSIDEDQVRGDELAGDADVEQVDAVDNPDAPNVAVNATGDAAPAADEEAETDAATEETDAATEEADDGGPRDVVAYIVTDEDDAAAADGPEDGVGEDEGEIVEAATPSADLEALAAATGLEVNELAQLFTVEGFDAARVTEVIETSTLSEVQQSALTAAVEAVGDNPAQIEALVQRLREALGL